MLDIHFGLKVGDKFDNSQGFETKQTKFSSRDHKKRS